MHGASNMILPTYSTYVCPVRSVSFEMYVSAGTLSYTCNTLHRSHLATITPALDTS